MWRLGLKSMGMENSFYWYVTVMMAIAFLFSFRLPKQPKQELCDLDALLGHAGHASPWLAIVAAAQTLERGAGPQFVFSGGSTSDAGLWGTVLTPASPPSK